MNAMIASMTAELKAMNIIAVGSYATLPAKMTEAVVTVKMFGYEAWEANTCMGAKLKDIVKKYAEA
jgi:hypothetical protein